MIKVINGSFIISFMAPILDDEMNAKIRIEDLRA